MTAPDQIQITHAQPMITPHTALTSDDIPPGPFSEDDLRRGWNQQADEHNQWESLDSAEQLAWAQARAIAADRARAALKAEPEGLNAADLLPVEPPKISTTMAMQYRSAWREGVEDGWSEARAVLARRGHPPAAAPEPGENLATPAAPPAPYIDPQGEDADKQLLEVFYRQMGRGLEVHPETLLRGIRGVRAFQFASSSYRLAPADVQQIIEALDFCIGDSDRRANSGNHHRLRQRLKRMIATLPSPVTLPAPKPGEVRELHPLWYLVEFLEGHSSFRRQTEPLSELAEILSDSATLLQQQEAELATLRGAPVAELDDQRREAVHQAVAEALGSGAYDCTRVWEAWQVGTMGEDDFVLVAEDPDRVAEIADAAIEAIRAIPAPQAGEVEA